MAYEARGWRYKIEAACLEVYKEVPMSAAVEGTNNACR
jgi:hypothetical protein